MSNEAVPASSGAPREASALAAIFQKAYARAVALQRLDEQISVLIEQRQKLESDFREAQAEVNDECERMLKISAIAPARMLAQLASPAEMAQAGLSSNGNGRLIRSPQAVNPSDQ
jgi:hypothetical protein